MPDIQIYYFLSLTGFVHPIAIKVTFLAQVLSSGFTENTG